MLTPSGELAVVDVKMRFNDDSVFRHPDLGLDLDRERSPFEREARRLGFTGVEMTGPVAVLANGAGLSMSVMDSLAEYGLRAGAFLDLSGTDDPSRVAEAVKLLLDRQLLPHIQGVLICVFGGITRCDTVAKGVLIGISEQPDFPVIVRFRGIMETEGIDLLKREGMLAWRDIDEACRSLARKAGGTMIWGLERNARVVVQGITGHQGRFHAQQMLEFGTNVVAGVSPGKGGSEVAGVPVYDSMAEAVWIAATFHIGVVRPRPSLSGCSGGGRRLRHNELGGDHRTRSDQGCLVHEEICRPEGGTAIGT